MLGGIQTLEEWKIVSGSVLDVDDDMTSLKQQVSRSAPASALDCL